MLRCVPTCWVLLAQILKLEPTASNMSQHIATRWPNAQNMFRPTMLRYVALAYCDRLASALDYSLSISMRDVLGLASTAPT